MEMMTASIRCLMCEKTFTLAQATGRPIDELPDPFAVRCPHCRCQQLIEKDCLGDAAGAPADKRDARARGPGAERDFTRFDVR
jgi:hypothetical protein